MFNRRLCSGVALLATLVFAFPSHAERAPNSLQNRPIVFGKHPVIIDLFVTQCYWCGHEYFRYEPLPTPRIFVADNDRKLVACITLTPVQVTRLNNLLTFYRSLDKSEEACLEYKVSLGVLVRGKKMRTEVYRTCAWESLLADANPEDLKGAIKSQGISSRWTIAPALTFASLSQAAEEAKEKGQSVVAYKDHPRFFTVAYFCTHEDEIRAYSKALAKGKKSKPSGR